MSSVPIVDDPGSWGWRPDPIRPAGKKLQLADFFSGRKLLVKVYDQDTGQHMINYYLDVPATQGLNGQLFLRFELMVE